MDADRMPQPVWYSVYDLGVPQTVPEDGPSLPELFRQAAAEFPDRPALIFYNRTYTYREFADQVARFATALAALGVERGTRVAIQVPNTPEFVVAYYAVLALGAVAAPTNPIYTATEIEHQWNDAGCDVAVVTDYLWTQRVEPIRDRLPIKHYVICSIPDSMRFPLGWLARLKLARQDPPMVSRVAPTPGVHRMHDLIRSTAPSPPAVKIDLDDCGTLLYTGGTTGVSKGAALTHRNLAVNVQQLRAWTSMVEPGREVVLTMLPLFHSYGLTVAMNLGISAAAALVLIPNPRDVTAIIKAISRHRVSLAPAVPATYAAIIRHPDIAKFDVTSIKMCNSGSAPLPVDVLERFETLTGGKITEGFGLTETSPVTHSNPIMGVRKVGSIGVPMPGTDAKIVDADDGSRTLPAGEVGELVVRGPQIMSGYWNRPEATREMIRNDWLFTGDLARMDQDGFFFIEGRKKDMILCSGFNVYPDEIDRVLMAHPSVVEAATIGVPDEKRGETVKSFVVVHPGQETSAEEILEHCRGHLAPYKVPRLLEFRDGLPKSAVQKILRRELRDQESAAP